MIKHKCTKKTLVITGLICIALVDVIIFCIWYPWRSTRKYDACVLVVRENSLLLRFDFSEYDLKSEGFLGSLYSVNLYYADFVSNHDTIDSIADLQPGMMVQVTVKNLEMTTNHFIIPGITNISHMRTATLIETDGEFDNALFRLGIDDVQEHGYIYADGKLSIPD